MNCEKGENGIGMSPTNGYLFMYAFGDEREVITSSTFVDVSTLGSLLVEIVGIVECPYKDRCQVQNQSATTMYFNNASQTSPYRPLRVT